MTVGGEGAHQKRKESLLQKLAKQKPMHKRSLYDEAVARGGVKAANRALTTALSWLIADAHDVESYRAYWKQSRAQAFRDLQHFREVWPEFDTPDALIERVVEVLGHAPTSVGDFGAVRWSA